MNNLGDRAVGVSLFFDFNTHKADGTPITLAGSPVVSVYKNSTTETVTGVTLTVDYDGRTGMHHVVIDTSDAFYAAGNHFSAVITTGTVNSISVVGTVIAGFSIGRANVSYINSIAATSVSAVNANIGTTQPTNFTGTAANALVKSDMVDIAGAAVNTATAQVGANVVSQANIDFGALQKASLNTAVYPDGFIYFNSAAANTNTVIGVDGTPANPVSTPAAAKTLADALGTKRIQIIGTWTNAVTMTGYAFSGNGHTAILDFNGAAMTGCFFEFLDLRGINTGLTNVYSKVTTISTFTVAGVVFDSEIGNNVTINGYTNLWNCQPTNTGAITLNFGATLQAVNIDNLYATYVTIAALANAGSTVDALFTGYPDIIIAASCTAGTINLMGFIKTITNLGTAVVNDRRTAVSIAGTTDANVVKINGSAPAAVQLAKSANTIADGTVNIVDFAPTTTEFETASLTDPATDFYKTRTVIFASGTLKDQARTIVASSYNAGTGKTHFTVQALTSAPATGAAFNIV